MLNCIENFMPKLMSCNYGMNLKIKELCGKTTLHKITSIYFNQLLRIFLCIRFNKRPDHFIFRISREIGF